MGAVAELLSDGFNLLVSNVIANRPFGLGDFRPLQWPDLAEDTLWPATVTWFRNSMDLLRWRTWGCQWEYRAHSWHSRSRKADAQECRSNRRCEALSRSVQRPKGV